MKKPKLNIDHVRVEAGYYGIEEIDHQPKIGLISFRIDRGIRLNVYLTKGTTVVQENRKQWDVKKNQTIDDVAGTMKRLSS